jgi:hypothetical protein
MATIITREVGATAKGSPLTNAEIDNNLINLNADIATRVSSSEKGSVNGIATLDGAGKVVSTQLPSLDYIPTNQKGSVNGVATLDEAGKVPVTQLPSYVDDVLEAANLAAFPVVGETGKIYVALDTNKTYRWSGSAYIFITSGAVDSVAGKTGVVLLNSSDVGLGNVDNTSDAAKPVSTAQQTALNLKADLNSPTFTGTVSGITAAMVGLGNVENKSSATIRGELTSANVTTALGFTPYNATNPSGYITSSALTPYLTTASAASTYQTILVSGTSIKTVNGQNVLGSGNIQIDGGVTSFNTRTGAITLSSGDVTGALGFTPYNATNPSGYTSNTGTVTSVGGTGTVSGLTLTGTVTGSGNLTLGGTLSLTSGQVTTALGFTPYNSTNPSGYITSSALSGYAPLTGTGASGTWGISITGNAATVTNGLYKSGINTVPAVITLNTTADNWMWLLQASGGNDWYAGPTTTNFGVGGNRLAISSSGSSPNAELVLERGTTLLLEVLQANLRYKSNVVLHAGNFTSYAQPTLVSGTNIRTVNGSSLLGSGDLVVSGADSTKLPLSGGTLTGALNVSRQRLSFSSSYNDANHSIYNNYTNIDGEGLFDGMKMNVYDGLRIRVGNASGTTPLQAFGIDSVGSVWMSQGVTLGSRTNSSTFGGNVTGMSGNSFVAEIRANAAKPTLTFHYENVATTHIEHLSDGSLNVWRPSVEGTSVFKIGNNVALHAGNYTSYSPSLGGSGASGTWGISVTGSASTLTSNASISGLNFSGVLALNASGATTGNSTGARLTENYGPQWNLGDGATWHYQILNGSLLVGISAGGTNYGSGNIRAAGNIFAGTSNLVWHSANAPRAGNSDLMYYAGFTLNANDMPANSTGFTYSVGAPHTGPVARFSTGGGYDLWLNAPYSGGGNSLSFRTRNGDSGTINPWRTVLHDGNYTSYAPSLTGGGASGTWGINITGNAGSISGQANSATITASTGVNGSHIVQRDGNGYIYANHINFNTGIENPTIDNFITGNGDGWSRKSSLAHVKNQIRGVADGTWGININGTFNSSGRCTSNEWIQFNNHTGLYSPINNAHFYPNNASYGSWKMDGSRNGWAGIEFDSGTSLMMNNDTHGFHRNIGGGWRFYNESGNGYFPGNVTAYWSDERLKENLREIRREALEILGAFTAYRFNWNAKVAEVGDTIPVGKEEIGLIAQHVQRALPDAVVVNKAGAKLGQTDFDYLTINYDRITPLVVEAVNIHEEDITELKTRTEQLEAKVTQLEAIIAKLIGD